MIISFLVLVIFCGILYYLYSLLCYQYWRIHDIPFVEPTFPLGNIKKLTKRTKHETKGLYTQLKGNGLFGGMFIFNNPTILALDLDFIKNVLVRDFDYFMDRGVYYNEKEDPISAHLFSLEGRKWKQLRSKLTPAFTSGKMKLMSPTILKVGVELCNVIDNILSESNVIPLREIFARYSTDVIGNCAFGIECNSLTNPNEEFRMASQSIFNMSSKQAARYAFLANFKQIGKFFKMKAIPELTANFFSQTIKEIIKYREETGTIRNDFINLLLQLKNYGKLEEDDWNEIIDKNGNNLKITENEIAAQAFIFFIAGFETASSILSFSFHEMALNHEIQEKARNEVITILNECNGELNYESLSKMKYMDQIIFETMRKYPPSANLVRVTTKDYYVAEHNYTIRKGMQVLIPMYAIQHDSEWYPKPDEFNPERFIEEEVKKRHSITFMSFGAGPRICIGWKFGMLQIKIAISLLLSNYKFSISEKTIIPLGFCKKSIVYSPEGDLYLNVEKIALNQK